MKRSRSVRQLSLATIYQPRPADSPAGPSSLSEPSSGSRLSKIRWGRCAAVSIPLIVLNCGWIANSEMKTNVTEGTISTLFMGVTFLLFVLTLVNLMVKRLLHRTALQQNELMAVYTMLSMSSVVAGVGHYEFLMPFLVNAFHYDTPVNGWSSFWHLLPSYIGPRDPEVLKGFYDGKSTFFQPRIMMAWAYPLAIWSGFFLVLIWTTLCAACIVRHRWQEEEHLPFPVIALPLEMTRVDEPIYKKKAMWIGFAVPFLLHSLNSLASIVPGIPTLKINSQHDLVADGALHFPWTGVDSLYYQLHPAGVGFGFLINTDISFSLWFFYLAKKLLNVLGVTAGWRDAGHGWNGDTAAQFPFTAYQGWGAWLALGITTIWAGRQYFSDYWRRAIAGKSNADDVMSPRLAIGGLASGFLVMSAFFWSSGGSWWLPPLFLLVYLLIMAAITRLRAETAVLCTELAWINPQSIVPALIGTHGLKQADLAHMGMMTWFNTDYRAAAMPHQLEGLAGMRKAGGAMSPMVVAIMASAAVAIVAASVWDLQMYYVQGADTANVNQWRVLWKGNEAWSNLADWIHTPRAADPKAIAGATVGFTVTCLLSALRMRFVGFPFHPAAYVLNTSFANDFFWGDMFVAWALKLLVMRYLGMDGYRKALPFFLGLILGDFVTGSAWSIIGLVFHMSLFRTFAT